MFHLRIVELLNVNPKYKGNMCLSFVTKILHVSVFMEAIPLFITTQPTLIQLNTTQVYLDSNCYF